MTLEERYRALGLEPPAAEGANEREPADPAEETETPTAAEGETDGAAAEETAEDGIGEAEDDGEEGANEQEPADPADEEDDNKPEQTPQERARNAARRREREKARRERERNEAAQAALREERAKVDAELKETFAWAGFKDGDKPIESMEELRAYRQRVQSEQLTKDLQAGKLTPEALSALVQQEVGKLAPPPAPEAEQAAFRQQVETELKEIGKYDPAIRTVEDLRTMDRAEEFAREVQEHNHSFLEAYRIVYADEIAEAKARKAAESSAQRTRNADRSKAHMRPTTARGQGDAPVPQSFLDKAAALMPKATPEQLRKYYQKYAKQAN